MYYVLQELYDLEFCRNTSFRNLARVRSTNHDRAGKDGRENREHGSLVAPKDVMYYLTQRITRDHLVIKQHDHLRPIDISEFWSCYYLNSFVES